MVKSWAGIAVGILKDEGYIKSETELYCKYVPEWEAGCKKDITIKHLLKLMILSRLLGTILAQFLLVPFSKIIVLIARLI